MVERSIRIILTYSGTDMNYHGIVFPKRLNETFVEGVREIRCQSVSHHNLDWDRQLHAIDMGGSFNFVITKSRNMLLRRLYVVYACGSCFYCLPNVLLLHPFVSSVFLKIVNIWFFILISHKIQKIEEHLFVNEGLLTYISSLYITPKN